MQLKTSLFTPARYKTTQLIFVRLGDGRKKVFLRRRPPERETSVAEHHQLLVRPTHRLPHLRLALDHLLHRHQPAGDDPLQHFALSATLRQK